MPTFCEEGTCFACLCPALCQRFFCWTGRLAETTSCPLSVTVDGPLCPGTWTVPRLSNLASGTAVAAGRGAPGICPSAPHRRPQLHLGRNGPSLGLCPRYAFALPIAPVPDQEIYRIFKSASDVLPQRNSRQITVRQNCQSIPNAPWTPSGGGPILCGGVFASVATPST